MSRIINSLLDKKEVHILNAWKQRQIKNLTKDVQRRFDASRVCHFLMPVK